MFVFTQWYDNPVLYDRENLLAASRVLRRAELYAEDYAVFLKQHARPGDFIYLDPPGAIAARVAGKIL